MSEIRERPRMKLLGWKAISASASLRGFATIELPIGLKLIDCPVMIGSQGPWAALPSKHKIGKDGLVIKGSNGKGLYEPVAEWRDRRLSDLFSASIVQLVRERFPGALD
jgi:hypothetical protein